MGDLGRMDGFTGNEVDKTRKWALEYERRGLRVLPSKPDKKAPMLPTYAQFWTGPIPPVSELWKRWPSGNLQIMTGPDSVVVLDCDGPAGVEQFDRWCRDRRYHLPRTWVSSNHATAGRHYWFTVPRAFRGFAFPPRRLLWGVWDPLAREGQGAWKKRMGIELLGARSLVMAPPSIHPDDRRRVYKWHVGSSPVELRYPAPLPTWLMAIPTCERPGREIARAPIARPLGRHVGGDLKLPARPTDVIRAIGDIEHFARSVWGLQVVAKSRLSSNGYKDCHDFNRDDRDPSARFRPADGRFWRPGMGERETWCLFRLGVEMGIYRTWREACIDLGRSYLPELFRGKTG